MDGPPPGDRGGLLLEKAGEEGDAGENSFVGRRKTANGEVGLIMEY